MSYDLSWMNETSTWAGLFTNVNNNTSGSFVAILLLILYIMILIVFKNYDTKVVFLIDGFFISVLSIIFMLGGWFPADLIAIPVILLVAAIIYYFLDPD